MMSCPQNGSQMLCHKTWMNNKRIVGIQKRLLNGWRWLMKYNGWLVVNDSWSMYYNWRLMINNRRTMNYNWRSMYYYVRPMINFRGWMINNRRSINNYIFLRTFFFFSTICFVCDNIFLRHIDLLVISNRFNRSPNF